MGDDAISVLNRLVEVCRNGQRGFHEAAGAVRDSHLGSVLLELSEQREQFAAQLRYEVARLSGRPADRGTVAGALHRRWMDLRSSVSPSSDRVILAECDRGEQFALNAYEQALRTGLPEPARAVVEDQAVQIRAASELIQSIDIKLRQQPCF